MAHARRKFEKALENDPVRAEKVLTLIQELYKIERQAREAKLSFEEIKMLRQKESVEVLCKLEKYLIKEHPSVLPQSSIGKAFRMVEKYPGYYTRLPQKPTVQTYTRSKLLEEPP